MGEVQPIRRMPVRTATLRFDGDYEGWECRVRVNPSLDTLERLMAAQGPEQRDVFASLILDWNFVDEQGDPIPLNGTGLGQLPPELFVAFGEKLKEQVAQAPKANAKP